MKQCGRAEVADLGMGSFPGAALSFRHVLEGLAVLGLLLFPVTVLNIAPA